MKVATNRRTIIVGLFIFIGLAFLVSGILAIGQLNKSFTRKVEILSVFDDVSGLQQGNNIWFSGVKIGTVKDLSFYGSSQVQVVMNIDEKSQPYIHKDAKAKISSDGLIGNKIIVIYGGTPSVPMVQKDDVLLVEKTFSTDDMMNTLQQNNVNILAITSQFKAISEMIRNGKGTLGKLLTDEELYNNLVAISMSVNKSADNAKKITADLSAFSAKLHQEGGFANDLVTDTTIFKNVKSIVAQLDQVAASANEVVANLKTATADPQSPLGLLLNDKQAGADMKSTIKNLEESSVKLNENMDALQHTFLLRGYFRKQESEPATTTPK
jgi:phospholipid/cholesterol/gamma-HCH transport system substrate-binding protein